jgi:hypothetical protein
MTFPFELCPPASPIRFAVQAVAVVILVPSLLCAQDSESAARLQAMEIRAASTSISFRNESQPGEITMLKSPLFRYSDEQRTILDGSFWCWVSEGRPVAFQKVERYKHEDPSLHWLYCFASASTKQIDVQWQEGRLWKSSEPGIKWNSVPAKAVPPTTRAFAVQAKNLARQCSVTLYEDTHKTQEQLRLLSRPIYEYETDRTNRGAVFGFATGTNPDAILLVEMDRSKENPEWNLGWIQMTAGRLAARVRGQTVWTAPYRQYAPEGRFESWIFFRENPDRAPVSKD